MTDRIKHHDQDSEFKIRYHNPSTYEKCVGEGCGKVRPVAKRTKEGKAICHVCYAKNYDKTETCVRCGKDKRVVIRDESGGAVCHSCHERDIIGICVECKEKKIIQALGRCFGCYKRIQRARKQENKTA